MMQPLEDRATFAEVLERLWDCSLEEGGVEPGEGWPEVCLLVKGLPKRAEPEKQECLRDMADLVRVASAPSANPVRL
jgi:hypothetical protein